MSILILQPGILTTMQDLGRFGYGRFGINPGGAMDRQAVRIVNGLLGNDENDPVIEMHFPAPRILFEQPCVFAIGGAELSPVLDDVAVVNWRPYQAESGSDLRFAAPFLGNRTYLAVQGGFSGDEWLGSSSTNLVACVGGINGRKLATGDRIPFRKPGDPAVAAAGTVATSMIPLYSRFPTLRVTMGGEYSLLTEQSMRRLETGTFNISNSSGRMGFRLDGPPLELNCHTEMLSSAVSMGTIQLLPDGQMIVLMADHQTTGGYPRIAHIIERDLPVLAQLGGGDKAAFHMVKHEESEQLNAEFERNMSLFRAGCRLRAKLYYRD